MRAGPIWSFARRAMQELRVELTFNVLKACHLFRCVDKGFISEEKIWLERIQCVPHRPLCLRHEVLALCAKVHQSK